MEEFNKDATLNKNFLNLFYTKEEIFNGTAEKEYNKNIAWSE